MRSYSYINTKTNIPNFETTTHISQPFGYGYETDTHFVHFFGKESFYIISVGLTVTEAKTGTFFDWIKKRFGATDIQEMNLEVGHSIEGIWRPSLFFQDDIQQALNVDPAEQRNQEQALRILVEKLDEILLFIEPSENGLNSYSHKIRELLILACTEAENQFRSLLIKTGYTSPNGANLTTQDYVKLLPLTFLDEYQVGLRNIDSFAPCKPFLGWEITQPTQSLAWYYSYNLTKHNRSEHFSEATLQHAIDAVAANIILYCTRFSPFILINDTNTLSALIQQIFDIKMIDSNRKSFYIPKITVPESFPTGCTLFDSYRYKFNEAWTIDSLKV
ncbi:MAG: hypothetical protein HGA33_01140 [Candidatus Moranbacteria bacterium]|nr:hypothetical protein [Candidatus Moranbacteria bacterium]